MAGEVGQPVILEILPGAFVDEAELRVQASRSSGPGGQNVNKVATRVTLFLDVEGAAGLSPEHKARIAARLASRISREGVLRVVVQRHRSQAANRREAVQRLLALLRQALEEDRQRTPTRPPRAVKEQRLADKRRRAERKRARRATWYEA